MNNKDQQDRSPERALHYHPCHYGGSKTIFRGPVQPLDGDYIAFIGGTETFGHFIETPYPALVEKVSAMVSVNLGSMNAGIDTYVGSPNLLDICSDAKVTVIQAMGAPNMSNRFYTVDPRHNERFLRASKTFKELYPEVHFAQFDFTHQMLLALAKLGPERLHKLRHEIQCAWVARMRTLLDRIEGAKILLWLSDHEPFSKAKGGTICRDPMFVDRAMINAVRDHADILVEVVGNRAEIEMGRKQMLFAESDRVAAETMLGPVVHDRVVDALGPALTEILPDLKQAFEAWRPLKLA